MAIPSPLDVDFRIATTRDIRSWSFGTVTTPRDPSTTSANHVRGTLHDQGIFGPIRDLRCACGRYAGDRFMGMICDRCGVKVAPSSIRGSRFAHIEFADPIPHPFSADTQLQCYPVVPALFIESHGGSELPTLYDRLIEAGSQQQTKRIREIIDSINDLLLPAVITAHNWRFAASRTLARGLALEHKQITDDSPSYCRQCGYVLAGLQVVLCPGCGTPIQ